MNWSFGMVDGEKDIESGVGSRPWHEKRGHLPKWLFGDYNRRGDMSGRTRWSCAHASGPDPRLRQRQPREGKEGARRRNPVD